LPPGGARELALNKAGHLMYASHHSYGNEAKLGAPQCDLLVKLVRQREADGLYGARITGGGQGGTVAVLAEASARADAALGRIVEEYQVASGRRAQIFSGSAAGAEAGTFVMRLSGACS
jgi:L-arabinokinase